MSGKKANRYSSRFKFQVVMDVIEGERTIGQIARCSSIHTASIQRWKSEFLEKGPEIFSQETTCHEYERRIQELERLIGHKEVEIALLKNFLTGISPEREESL